MGYADYLRQMLKPVAVYDLDTGAGAVELDAEGSALDKLFAAITEAEVEAIILTACRDGLSGYEEILPYAPLSSGVSARRAAIAALLRVDEASFTLPALRDTLKGIGLEVAVLESETPLTVCLSFPGVRGVPVDFEELNRRIEMILPCHLGLTYSFVYLLWHELEGYFSTWGELEAAADTWNKLESYMP